MYFSRSNALLIACLVVGAECWSSVSKTKNTNLNLDRRSLFHRTASAALIGTGILINNPSISSAAAPPPTPAELERLQKGYARVRYLLDNWDTVTSKCGTIIMSDLERKQVIRTEGGGGGGGNGGCEKTPLRVQEFLGYKSTNDPLFKADKLMVRAAPLVDPDQFEEYLDTVERYREKADQGAMMAYTSSWGEANPNGSKEAIEEYLESTRVEVLLTEELLCKVLGYLNLSIPPPLTGKL